MDGDGRLTMAFNGTINMTTLIIACIFLDFVPYLLEGRGRFGFRYFRVIGRTVRAFWSTNASWNDGQRS